MPEFLKHWPKRFQQWFLNWELWTVSDKGRLTGGTLLHPQDNRIHPAPGWDSHGNTHCSLCWLGEVWFSQPLSLWVNWHLHTHIKSHTLQIPSPVWLPKLFVGETNSGSGPLTTHMSNFFFNMCTNCIHCCGFEDSKVKTRSCVKNRRTVPDSKSHSSTGSKSNSDFFQVSWNEPSLNSACCKTGN